MIIFLFLFLFKTNASAKEPAHVLIINQVRGEECCSKGTLINLKKQVEAHTSKKVPAYFALRHDVLIDKIVDTTFRVFDNEQTSSYGSVNKEKKVHCIINDLRLGDVFIIEYSLVNLITEDNLLDKKYYRSFRFCRGS